jgi:hypothetical protein
MADYSEYWLKSAIVIEVYDEFSFKQLDLSIEHVDSLSTIKKLNSVYQEE